MIKNSIENIRPKSEELNGIYRGVIEDNNDPEKAGRCKIRVFGVHTENKYKSNVDGIPTDELPWAEPALGLLEGSVSGYGSGTVPLQGSHVFLFFEAGNPLQPRYFASVPGMPTEAPENTAGFNDPDEKYPDKLNEPDGSRDARGVESRNRNGTIEYGPEYPHNSVFSTHGDLVIEIDSTPNKERINIWHRKADSYMEMDTNGNMVISNSNDRFDNINNNETKDVGASRTSNIGTDESKTIGGSQTVDVSGDKTDTIGGNNTVEVNGNEEKTVSGSGDITASASITIISSTSVTISAPSVSISS